MAGQWTNKLYFGDNLDIMRNHIADERVDLIYLDPPFNSEATYNVLFGEKNGTASAAQIQAFEDTWHWDVKSEAAYIELAKSGRGKLSDLIQAMRQFLGPSDMMAYLVMMAIRLLEMHRVLKHNGTLYLHCDSRASHYIKILLDSVFGPERFLNEVVWKRTHSHGNVGRNFGSITDSLLVYVKGNSYAWYQQYTGFSRDYIERTFRHQDPDGRRWQSVTLRNPGPRPNLHFPFAASNGLTYSPHPNGWGCDLVRLQQYDREGRLHFPKKPTGALRLKMYLDESSGVRLQNLWDDISPIASQAAERLGYPTQKPEALLERIIATSSAEGDLVLDPFCGCGTTVNVAERLKRRWIGIDITHLAITLIINRLRDTFGSELTPFEVIGDPKDRSGARALADQDRYQFQWWALGKVGARPAQDKKKGADTGIDGWISFFDDASGQAKRIVIQVKSGHVKAGDIRDLKGVMDREKAELAAFLALEPATREMATEAASAGFYEPEAFPGQTYPRLQILTVQEILEGRQIEYPRASDGWLLQAPGTFKRAKRRRPERAVPKKKLV